MKKKFGSFFSASSWLSLIVNRQERLITGSRLSQVGKRFRQNKSDGPGLREREGNVNIFSLYACTLSVFSLFISLSFSLSLSLYLCIYLSTHLFRKFSSLSLCISLSLSLSLSLSVSLYFSLFLSLSLI